MGILEAKADALSPNGSFEQYYSDIMKTRKSEAKNSSRYTIP